jgi:rubrerythrin
VQNMCSGMGSLQVKSEQEALFLACEMERRAIRVYERGVMISHDPAIKVLLQKLHDDEKAHLTKFSKMGNCSNEITDREQQLLLKSYAAQVLFPGGLMQAHREGALDSLHSLLEFSRDSEETAVRSYTEFAASCQTAEARNMFLSIAQEEQSHLVALEEQLESL